MRKGLLLLAVLAVCCCTFACDDCQVAGSESSSQTISVSLENSSFSGSEEITSLESNSSMDSDLTTSEAFSSSDEENTSEENSTEGENSANEEVSAEEESSASGESSEIEGSSGREESSETESPHEHDFCLWSWNNDRHWKECACGEKTEDSEHTLDGNNDCVECEMHYGTAGIVYELSGDGSYYIVGEQTAEALPSTVYILSVYEGKPVKEVGMYAFTGFPFEKVVLPNGIERIEKMAFARCENLKKITIGEGLQRVEDSAFLECYSLRRISFPATLKSVGKKAFIDCPTTIEVIFENDLGWSVSDGERELPLSEKDLESAGVYLTGAKPFEYLAEEHNLSGWIWNCEAEKEG